MVLSLIKFLKTYLLIASLLFWHMPQLQAETVKIEGSKPKSNLMSTLTMTAVSLVTSRLIMYGKMTPDVLVASGAGLAYLMADITTTKKLKKAAASLEMHLSRKTKTGEIYDNQREALISLRALYMDAKNAAESKKSMHKIVSMGFMAAAAMAYFQVGVKKVAEGACTACPAANAPIAESNSYQIITQPVCSELPLFTSSTAAIAAAAGVCSSTPATAGGAAACTAYNTQRVLFSIPSCGTSLAIIGTLGALITMLGGYEGPLFATLLSLSTTVTEFVDTYIFNPEKRVILWGILAAIVTMSSSSISQEISTIEENIRKINSILEPLNAQANGVVAKNAKNAPDSNGSLSAQYSLQGFENEETKLPCLTSESLTEKNCPSYSDALNKSLEESKTELSPEFKTSMTEFAKGVNGLNGASKISAGSLKALSSFGNNSQAIANALEKSKEGLKSTEHLNAVSASLKKEAGLSSLNDLAGKNLAKTGLNFPAGPSSMGMAQEPNQKDNDPAKGTELGKKKSAPLAMEKNLSPLNLSSGTTLNVSKDEEEKLSTDKELAKFEVDTDVTNDENKNLFEIISHRFQATGMKRLNKVKD